MSQQTLKKRTFIFTPIVGLLQFHFYTEFENFPQSRDTIDIDYISRDRKKIQRKLSTLVQLF